MRTVEVRDGMKIQEGSPFLEEIERHDEWLYAHFRDAFLIETSLNRTDVSFQASKARGYYRWYKFKEAFSPSLVEYLLYKYGISKGTLLDPFAGSGTALFVASEAGLDAAGIEVLPVGQQIIHTKLILDHKFTTEDFASLKRWLVEAPWKHSSVICPLPSLRITEGAYPEETVESIQRYLGAHQQENARVRAVLFFALLCVLESVSYTRKDGQYLRWDHRSGRKQGARPFNKGEIKNFDQAISAKIEEILLDVQNKEHVSSLFSQTQRCGKIETFDGSCLDILPVLSNDSFDTIITSPPYCNRYDYTRTYALELALLGVGERDMVDLRQRMVSCTVENRAKDLLAMTPRWAGAVDAADEQALLQAVLRYLEDQKAQGKLNNNGIPRMVRGYFYEMACVIAECYRVLRPGAYLFMVNDNVRYAGASISADMILSSIAESLGFRVENILVLPGGKGNSSQQMGRLGRDILRKCVYVWRKP